MSLIIRRATAADQATIEAIVRQARLSRNELHWPRFIVATAVDDAAVNDTEINNIETDNIGKDAEGQPTIVGIGQLRPHADGSAELRSLGVLPAYQKQGVGRAIVQTLLSLVHGPVYLRCEGANAPYYRRLGFVELHSAVALPDEMVNFYRFVPLLLPLVSLIMRQKLTLAVMVYPQVYQLP